MKVYIRKTQNSVTGYELVSIDDIGNETVQPINEKPKNEPHTLILPENASNRKYFSDLKVDKNGGQIELTYKESKVLGPRGESTPRKKLEDYMTDEEKATIEAILNKAKERRDADKKKPMSEKEKLEQRIAKLTAKLEAMGDE